MVVDVVVSVVAVRVGGHRNSDLRSIGAEIRQFLNVPNDRYQDMYSIQTYIQRQRRFCSIEESGEDNYDEVSRYSASPS